MAADGGSATPPPSPTQDASVPQAILELSESGALEFGAQRLGVSVERPLQLSQEEIDAAREARRQREMAAAGGKKGDLDS